MSAKNKQPGFTIVELLIVIVVIGILAAITIVAYNGIQQRARNTQVTSGVSIYVKALESYRAINGNYPTQTGCLGANYPSDRCWINNTNPDRVVNAALDSQLSEFVSSKPTLATKLLDLGLTGNPSYYQRAGLSYAYTNSTSIELRYYLEGLNQPCVGGFTAANEGFLSRCIMSLTN